MTIEEKIELAEMIRKIVRDELYDRKMKDLYGEHFERLEAMFRP